MKPPVAARPVVYAFLVAFAASLLLSVEWWPFTAFKLFSHVRTGTVAGWEVTVVDGGAERPVDWEALPRGYRGWYQQAGRLAGMAAADRDRVLRSWGEAVRRYQGSDVSAVRVYRTRAPVRTDPDQPPPAVNRALRWELAL